MLAVEIKTQHNIALDQTRTMAPIPGDIKKYLKVLGIKRSFSFGSSKVPSHAAVRKAFRSHLMKEHPDKGGDNNTFQELSEAAREVFDYIEKNPEMVEEQVEADTDTTEEQDNLKELLRIFSTSSDLKYNDGSVVFNVEKEHVSKWMSEFKDYFDSKRKLNTTGESILFKNDSWVLPEKKGEEMIGTLTVTLWPNPNTNPKVMVQGKMYMAFVAMVLPTIAMSVLNQVPTLITDKSEGKTVKASTDKESVKVKETATKGEKILKQTGEKVKENPKDIIAKDVVGVNETPKEDETPKNDNKVEEEPVKEGEATKDDGLSKNKDDIEDLKAAENDPETVIQAMDRFQRAFIDKCGDIDNKMTISLEKQADMTKHIAALKEEVSTLREEVKLSKDEIKTEVKEVGEKVDTFQQNWYKKYN